VLASFEKAKGGLRARESQDRKSIFRLKTASSVIPKVNSWDVHLQSEDGNAQGRL